MAKKNNADKNHPPEASHVNGTEAAAASAPLPPPPSFSSPSSHAATAALTATTALGLHIAPFTFAWGLHALYPDPRGSGAAGGQPADVRACRYLRRGLPRGPGQRQADVDRQGGAAGPCDDGVGCGRGRGRGQGHGVVVVNVGDVVSPATRRAGVAHGVWSAESVDPPGRGKGAGDRGGVRQFQPRPQAMCARMIGGSRVIRPTTLENSIRWLKRDGVWEDALRMPSFGSAKLPSK